MYGFEEAKTALSLDNIFSIIAKKCVTAPGAENIANLLPYTQKEILIEQIDAVNTIGRINEKNGLLPLKNHFDFKILLNKIEPQNSFLESRECLEVQNILEITAELIAFFKNENISDSYVSRLVEKLDGQKNLLNQLQYTIEPSGEIFDNASKELKEIRKKLRELKEEVNRKLQTISLKNAEHLMEDFITLRDGRLVLPVREFSVSRITGIVHGQSSSGATKYVEPMSVVGLNNEIQELLIDEKREIIKILTRLSNLIREAGPVLIQNQGVITTLDILQARALYGSQIGANPPQIVDDHYWHICGAKHPVLLDRIGTETVPLNLELGNEYSMLIISGPNAGGKTVAMKTIGLIQLMLQCAIPVPVEKDSRFPVCNSIFVQIGDKQSIENDLSTFSSHITGLNKILKNVQDRSLVLIDEIGIGTEPTGGAALALAILEKLNRPGIATLVSTHQNQLKVFASETPGVQNAAMQFDIKELKPLFIMECGVPGSSFTFDICSRFGVDKEIIQRSRELEGSDNQHIDKLLNDIAEKSAFYQNTVREMSLKQSKLDGLVNLYEKNSNELKRQRKLLEKEAKQQAKAILDEANKKIEKVIREIRESAAEKTVVKKLRNELNDFRKNLNEIETDRQQKKVSVEDIQVGQKIRSLTYNIVGQVSKIFKNKNAVELEREGLKLTINISELELLTETGQTINPEASRSITNIPSTIKPELDIRGCDVDDALQRLEAYLESSVNSNWSEVTIIHGKGTGTLRQAVQQLLKSSKHIRDFRTGRYGEGESGVTMVTLK
jgi:DNA mismatch repair protein MutS2